jgi:hypothetical protein
VKDKFAAMKTAGKIVSLAQFEKIKDDYYIHIALDRELYLKNAINESKDLQSRYDVPDYVIVAPDPDKIQ